MESISERDARMFELLEAGRSVSDISAAISVSEVTIKRRIQYLRGGKYHPSRIPGKRGTAAESAEKQRVIIEMFDGGASTDEIAAAVGLSVHTITVRIRPLKDHGTSRDEMPTGDNGGFLKALRAAHSEGAGEKLNPPREPMGRFYPVDTRSGCGSSMASCVEN